MKEHVLRGKLCVLKTLFLDLLRYFLHEGLAVNEDLLLFNEIGLNFVIFPLNVSNFRVSLVNFPQEIVRSE